MDESPPKVIVILLFTLSGGHAYDREQAAIYGYDERSVRREEELRLDWPCARRDRNSEKGPAWLR
jgi:hypothetical protein